jgi:hypothetical protein
LDVGEQFIAARSASWSACSGIEAAPKEKSRNRDMAAWRGADGGVVLVVMLVVVGMSGRASACGCVCVCVV